MSVEDSEVNKKKGYFLFEHNLVSCQAFQYAAASMAICLFMHHVNMFAQVVAVHAQANTASLVP